MTTETAPPTLLEYEYYPDNGCEVAPSCLNCPLPKCVEDVPKGKFYWKKNEQVKEITKLFCEGRNTKEIASLLNISYRTVIRALTQKGGTNQ